MSDAKYDKSDSSISMEAVYVQHYMLALDRLQSCWTAVDDFNKDKFNLQLLYLIRLLPNRAKQNEIMAKWQESLDESKQIMPSLSDRERQAFAGMEIVTELVLFVCDAFELINEDIMGPATSYLVKDPEIELCDPPNDDGVIQL